jgi:hypothetical protein
MAGHFHLLAQMKVTKAKGPTSVPLEQARGFGWRRTVQRDALRARHEEQMQLLFVPDAMLFPATRLSDNRFL